MDEVSESPLTGKDGVSYRLRPIRPSHAASLVRGYEALPDESKRFRMLMTVPHMTEAVARSFCRPDPRDTIRLVVEGQGALADEIIAGARVAGLEPGKWAEFSVSAHPEAQGLVLSRQALDAVVEVARACGCSGVWGMIVDENASMLGLARRLGMSVRNDTEDWTVEIAELSFDGGVRPEEA